jgi:hypothetical protein
VAALFGLVVFPGRREISSAGIEAPKISQ